MRKTIALIVVVAGIAAVVLGGAIRSAARMALPASGPALAPPAATGNADAGEAILSRRGLIGEHVEGRRIAAPPGVEVYETVQTAISGQVMSHTKAWGESLARDTLWIEVTDFPSRQYQVSFWLLAEKARGCALFGRTMYSQGGRRLQSEFWRNDRALRITGAADFPPDLYPSAVPAVVMPRVLDSLHSGAQGRLSLQITPYGYVDQKVSVERRVELKVPAGDFSACKISAQADMSKLLPNWPHMLLRVVGTFVPSTTYYFQCAPPYRFLKKEQQGSPFVGGPEATTELVRYYTAGVSARRWSGGRLAAQ